MDELTFQKTLQGSPIDVPRAAFSLAKELAHPDLDIDCYLDHLDVLAVKAQERISMDGDEEETALALAAFLFDQEAFQGNEAEYFDPRNSYLNEVIDRRLGIPITLSVIFIAVAQRLGLPAEGVGMPGHFIVRVGDLFLDPFHRGQPLSIEDCARLVEETTGYQGPFEKAWLETTPPMVILTRMLNNLRSIYVSAGNWPRAIKVVERLRMTQPEEPDYLRDLGLLHYHNGSLRQSIECLSVYLQNEPDAKDAARVKQSLGYIAHQLAKLN